MASRCRRFQTMPDADGDGDRATLHTAHTAANLRIEARRCHPAGLRRHQRRKIPERRPGRGMCGFTCAALGDAPLMKWRVELRATGYGLAMEFSTADTAVVFIDPQVDVLSPDGRNWGALGESVTENKTVEHMLTIFEASRRHGYRVFISPHYFYPTDEAWLFNGPLESEEFRTKTFSRTGPLDLSGFVGSGADWLEEFKPYINDAATVIASPHKVFGPQTNDLVLQLRKHGFSKVILGGMLANMCVESHLRDLLEEGFEVVVVCDATAGPRHSEWGDGYQAALINYRYLAHAVVPTEEVVSAMAAGGTQEGTSRLA
jgi:nicotinamidase-related amidase